MRLYELALIYFKMSTLMLMFGIPLALIFAFISAKFGMDALGKSFMIWMLFPFLPVGPLIVVARTSLERIEAEFLYYLVFAAGEIYALFIAFALFNAVI